MIYMFLYVTYTRIYSMLYVHLSVAVVTIGGKKDLGHFFNPSQEYRNIWL